MWPAEPSWLWSGMLGTGQVSGMFPRQNVKKMLLTARGSFCVSLGTLQRFRTDSNLFGARRLWFLFERRHSTCPALLGVGGGLGVAWFPSNALWEAGGLGVWGYWRSAGNDSRSWSRRAFQRPRRPTPALQLAYSTPCCRFLEAHWTSGKKMIRPQRWHPIHRPASEAGRPLAARGLHNPNSPLTRTLICAQPAGKKGHVFPGSSGPLCQACQCCPNIL